MVTWGGRFQSANFQSLYGYASCDAKWNRKIVNRFVSGRIIETLGTRFATSNCREVQTIYQRLNDRLVWT